MKKEKTNNNDFFNSIANAGAFLKQRESWLNHKINLKPDNIELLYQLGEIYRQQGKFPQALTLYEKVLKLEPHHKTSNFLKNLFSHQGITPNLAIKGIQPSPFVHFKNFLDNHELESVWHIVDKHQQ